MTPSRARVSWIAAALVVSAAAGSLASPDPREILLRSLSPTDTTFTAEQVTTVSRAGRVTRQAQTVYRKEQVIRIEYAGGQTAFDDGNTQLLYLPRLRTVQSGPSPQRDRGQIRQALRQGRLTVEGGGEGDVAGRPAYIVTVTPRAPRRPVRTMWIDRETYLPLRVDETRPDGAVVSTFFTQINYAAAPPPAMLVFTPPADARVVPREFGRPLPEARALALARGWGGIRRPSYLPPGYRFQSFHIHRFKAQEGLVAVFSRPDGVPGAVTVFQCPAAGMGEMAEAFPGRRGLRVLTARKGAADVAVAGELPEEELRRILDSIPAA